LEFIEKLPPFCPPSVAKDCISDFVFRAIKGTTPTMADFRSHKALGKHQPIDIDDCRWASCSFFLSEASIRRLKKFRNLKVAKLKIPSQVGLSVQRNDHIDFWIFKGVDLSKFVVEVL
jgi:hypothetical protein